MSTVITQSLTLEEFLKLPETKPASIYINGEIIQKPMPKGKHSRLQLRLCNSINDVVESVHIAYAFPELRCSFGIRSVVPDVAVFNWSRIPFAADGEAPNDFLLPPDWTIEILSPEQYSLLLRSWLPIRLVNRSRRSFHFGFPSKSTTRTFTG
jgi:Uma2 family endonuclease